MVRAIIHTSYTSCSSFMLIMRFMMNSESPQFHPRVSTFHLHPRDQITILSPGHPSLPSFHPPRISFFLHPLGPTGGGKSTYLQSLAQLVILAQMGSFLPAFSASLKLCSGVFTRMGSSDSIESSASSFLVEMKETRREGAPPGEKGHRQPGAEPLRDGFFAGFFSLGAWNP